MADFEHCFGCRKSVYVDNTRKKHCECKDKVCLYCFEHHKYMRKGALSNLQCFKREDKNNPSTLMEDDVRLDRAKFGKLSKTHR